MTDETESRRRALAFNAVGPAVNSRGYWLPLSARRAVADAVLDAVADDLEAARRNAIRIQILLDEQRDRIRKIHNRYADGTCFADGEPYPCPTITALELPKEARDA